MLADLRFAQILDLCVQRPAVVPGDAGRLLNESGQHAAPLLRVDGLGPESDPEAALPVPGGGRAMGPRLAGRGPDDQDDPIVDRLRRQDGLIGRIEPVAVAANPLLRCFELRGGQTGGGQGGSSVLLRDADDDVASVQVVVVVRESADRPKGLGAGPLRIPRRLELHPLGLDPATAEEIVEVDGEDRAHGFNGGSSARPRLDGWEAGGSEADVNGPRTTRPRAARGHPAHGPSSRSPSTGGRLPRSPGLRSARPRRAGGRSRATGRGPAYRSRR